MIRTIVFIVVEIISIMCALMGLGQAVEPRANKHDKTFGFIVCFLFLLFTLFTEVVLR